MGCGSSTPVYVNEKLNDAPDLCSETRFTTPPAMCRPPPTDRATPPMRDRTESDIEQEEDRFSWPSSMEPPRARERRRSTDEGSHRHYDIPLLTRAFEWPSPERDEPPRFPPRSSPAVEPPPTPTTDPPGGRVPPHRDPSDSRLLWPLHSQDALHGRHRSAPLYGSNDWQRRMSFGQLPPPNHPEGSSSRIVLPPVSHLLGELGMDPYEPGPVLPQLRLPEEATMGMPRAKEAKGEGKRVVRKIYVACDFCRGRKLRCDGGRPRCSNCETRSLACRYQEHPRRRGPGKAPKGSRGKKAGRKGEPDVAGPSGIP